MEAKKIRRKESNFQNKRLYLSPPLKEEIKQPFKTSEEASFPIGYCDFMKMVTTTNIFVDKTLFIKQIIEMKDEAILITRPRRWGKTLNMNMLYYFFNQQVDKEGKPLQPQPHRVLFAGGETTIIDQNREEKIYLSPLKIAQETNRFGIRYLKFQGAYPVIYMPWKDIKPKTFEKFKEKIEEKISLEFSKHEYLYNALMSQPTLINKRKAQQFESLVFRNSLQTVLEGSLRFLSQLLREYHGNKTYLLIDQYDAPFKFMLERGIDLNQRNRVAQLIKSILSHVLKGNGQNLEKGILTGIFDTLKKEAGSGLNNIQICSITDNEFSQFYGFSRQEIEDQLVDKMFESQTATQREEDQPQREELLKRITQWYNGYIVPQKGGIYRHVYNPFAVVKYLKKTIYEGNIVQGKAYWSLSGSDQWLRLFFSSSKQRQVIEKVLSLDISKPESMAICDNIKLQIQIFLQGQIKNILHIFSFTRAIQLARSSKEACVLQFLIEKLFMEWGIDKKLMKDLSPIDLTKSQELKDKMLQTFRYLQHTIGNKNENMFNSIFASRYYWSTFSNKQSHTVSIQFYSGQGLIDTIFYPKIGNSDTIIIHKYRYVKDPQRQKASYEDALWQTYEKNYLNHPLCISRKCQFVKRIIVRAIVIVFSEANNSLSLYMQQDFIHTLEEVQQIIRYFSQTKIKDTLMLNSDKRNKNEARTRLLTQERCRNIQELREEIINFSKSKKQLQLRAFSFDLNPTEFNYSLAIKNLLSFHDKRLFYDQATGEPTSIYRSFKLIFKYNLSLFYATKNEIRQVDFIYPKRIEAIYNALQEMKKNPDYFIKEPVTLPKKKEGKRKAKSCDPPVANRAKKPAFLEENGTMQNQQKGNRYPKRGDL